MTEIINAIDDWTLSRYGGYNVKLWGFCELMRKTSGANNVEQVFPVTIPETPSQKREQVAIDDRHNFITWIRVQQPTTYTPSEEFSFGKREARMGVVPVRIVLAHRTFLGEDLATDFVDNFPSKFDNVTGFRVAFVDGAPTIDPDHEAIHITEFGSLAYEKHRFDWNLYAITVNMQFIACEALTP